MESDNQVAMPYLQSLGAPVVALTIAAKNGEYR